VYDASDRFSSFQVGVGIPVFRKGYRSAVKGAKMQEEVKMKEYEAVMHEFQTRLDQQYLLYNETMTRIQQFRKQSLPNARLIRSVSEKKFTAGEINYLEFVMLINQAVQIESDYLELISKANTYIINLYYLTHQN
jgi:cobalt-zinc-cadmium resistance protein CzcA